VKTVVVFFSGNKKNQALLPSLQGSQKYKLRDLHGSAALLDQVPFTVEFGGIPLKKRLYKDIWTGSLLWN
jgi:hypothetical protein